MSVKFEQMVFSCSAWVLPVDKQDARCCHWRWWINRSAPLCTPIGLDVRQWTDRTACNGYLGHPFEKVVPWAFTARLFLVIKWNSAIEIAGE